MKGAGKGALRQPQRLVAREQEECWAVLDLHVPCHTHRQGKGANSWSGQEQTVAAHRSQATTGNEGGEHLLPGCSNDLK